MGEYPTDMGIYGDHLPAAIAIELGAELDYKGMQKSELAELTGLGVNSVGRYLAYRGVSGPKARKLPLDTFALMCEAMNVSPDVIMARAVKRSKDM